MNEYTFFLYSHLNFFKNVTYNPGKKKMAKRKKMALSLTPQAMHNQFKRPSAGTVRELYYIYRKT